VPVARAILLAVVILGALVAGTVVGRMDRSGASRGVGAYTPGALAGGTVPATPRGVPIGHGAALRPGPGAVPSEALPCRPLPDDAQALQRHDAVHLELFAAGRVVLVPAGVGIGRPLRREGPYVTGGRCAMAVHTTEPTGVVELSTGARLTLGDLFAVWGRPLADRRLLAFRGRVRAWVDGVRWTDRVRSIPLRRHRQIVLVAGPDVPVHATYAFPPDGVSHLRQ
jgi:hypothetical protein